MVVLGAALLGFFFFDRDVRVGEPCLCFYFILLLIHFFKVLHSVSSFCECGSLLRAFEIDIVSKKKKKEKKKEKEKEKKICPWKRQQVAKGVSWYNHTSSLALWLQAHSLRYCCFIRGRKKKCSNGTVDLETPDTPAELS